MPESKPRVIDPPEIFRSPNYANIVVANGFAFIAGQTAVDRSNLPVLVEVRRAIVALSKGG